MQLNNNCSLPITKTEVILHGDTLFKIIPIEKGRAIEITELTTKKRQYAMNRIFYYDSINEVTIEGDINCVFIFWKINPLVVFKRPFNMIDGNKTKPPLTERGHLVFIHSYVIRDQMIAEILTSEIKIRYLLHEVQYK